MRLQKRGFNLRKNRIHFSRLFLILIVAGLLSSTLQACSSDDELIEDNIDTIAPITTIDGKPIKEGSETQEVNTAIQCDGEIDENGKLKPGSTKTSETSDDCDTISGVPYFQPDPEISGSGAIYYRQSPGANVIVVHDHYTPTFWRFGGSHPSIIMPSSMMYSNGVPVIQGSYPVLATTPNNANTSRTPISFNNGKATYSPIKSNANFIAPLTNTSINGGKISASHLSATSRSVSIPRSSFTSTSRSAPSRASFGSSRSTSIGKGVSVGGRSSTGG